MARTGDGPQRDSAGLFLGPLGCYLRDGERPLAARVTSLLAIHRVVSGSAFRGSLWNLSGTDMGRTLLGRLRVTTPANS